MKTKSNAKTSPAKGQFGNKRNAMLVVEQASAVPKDRGAPMTKKGTTNAFRLTPALNENVKSEVKKDFSRVKKALKSGEKSSLPVGARDTQKLAGIRAASRLIGRANLVTGAATTGVAIGKRINEGVEYKKKMTDGKKKVDSKMNKTGNKNYKQAVKNNSKGVGGFFR